jgi:hypothetical protein
VVYTVLLGESHAAVTAQFFIILCQSSLCFACCAGHAGSSSSSQGSTDLHSLVQLLAGRCPNLAATSMQLPTGALPADEWAQAAAADGRLSTPAAAAPGEQHPLRYLQLQKGALDLMAVPTTAKGKGNGAAAAEEAAAAAALDQGAECITLRGGAFSDWARPRLRCALHDSMYMHAGSCRPCGPTSRMLHAPQAVCITCALLSKHIRVMQPRATPL